MALVSLDERAKKAVFFGFMSRHNGFEQSSMTSVVVDLSIVVGIEADEQTYLIIIWTFLLIKSTEDENKKKTRRLLVDGPLESDSYIRN